MNADKLEACKKTRIIAADSLYKALKDLLSQDKQISEVDLRDHWLLEMRKHEEIFPDGWYIPPPHGIIVLFGTDKDTSRTKFKSARPDKWWPRNDIFLNKQNGIILLYASPVDKDTGIIGDFELTLYLGQNEELNNYLKTCLLLNYEIFDHIKVDMQLLDIAQYAEKLYKKYNLVNNVLSTTDSAVINVGHTIPFSYEDMDENEKQQFQSKEWSTVCSLISHKRVFVNKQESFTIKPDMAVTIEPRATAINQPNLPLVMFHTITLFKENGEKELLTNFDEILKLCGMGYLL
ncbi:MAG: M24 family metallopeptidase [Candidatus Levybacteria bacterium]|nr:M24 family metallopeptidase [Candidatus Levybacteria bacterium]